MPLLASNTIPITIQVVPVSGVTTTNGRGARCLRGCAVLVVDRTRAAHDCHRRWRCLCPMAVITAVLPVIVAPVRIQAPTMRKREGRKPKKHNEESQAHERMEQQSVSAVTHSLRPTDKRHPSLLTNTRKGSGRRTSTRSCGGFSLLARE